MAEHLSVLVTGSAGFIGAHITTQLLEGGYRVIGTARGAKVEKLQKAFAQYGNRFRVVKLADATSGDLSGIFQGIDAVIHTATLVPQEKGVALESVIEQALHIFKEAAKAGVKKFIYTSSMVNFPPGGPYGADDWNSVTEEISRSSAMYKYIFARTSCERAFFEFAEAHPEMDVTTLSPPWVFGPLAPAFTDIAQAPDLKSLSSVAYIYALLRPGNTDKNYSPPGFGGEFIDVRDLARVHVAALRAPPTSSAGKKRYAVISPVAGSMKDAIYLIAAKRPHLKERLADPSQTADSPVTGGADPSLKRLEEAVGVKREEYKAWEECVLDTVDSLIKVEGVWKGRGYEVAAPEKVSIGSLLVE